jgi:hypothetical protein
MTIEHAPSTNGRVVHTEPAQQDARAVEATEQGGSIGRLIMPLLLMAVALVVLRRLSRATAAS